MKPLYILKIGGSVATYKNRSGLSIKKALLRNIAYAIKEVKKEKNLDLILVHGAGAAGHQLAKKYKLAEGVGINPKKWYGALISRLVNHKLNSAVLEILIDQGLRATAVHTATAIIQKDKKIHYCNLEIMRENLKQDCIPVLYGEMVFDTKIGMSICSGDAIVPYLARKLGAQKILYASDIDGIFDKDPYIHKDAVLIEKIVLNDISKRAKLSESHNTDVTNGLLGKIQKLSGNFGDNLRAIEIFNGLKKDNYKKVLLGEPFKHTVIFP